MGLELTLVAMCAVNEEPSEFRKPVVDTKGTALASWEVHIACQTRECMPLPRCRSFQRQLRPLSPGRACQAAQAAAQVSGSLRLPDSRHRCMGGGPRGHRVRCPKGHSSNTVAVGEHLGSVDDGLHKCDSGSTLDDSLQEGHGGRAEDVVHLSDLAHKLLLRPAHTRRRVNGSELATQREIRIAKGLVWLWKQQRPGQCGSDRQAMQPAAWLSHRGTIR